MSERQLVTVRRISSLTPIPGADAIEVAQVDGWKVVVKKGEFKEGDLAIYFEIDSFLPESDPRYSFLMKSGVRVFEGERGHKLRTIKLRGQISQGLLLPVNLFFEDFVGSEYDEGQELSEFFLEGADLTDFLKIKKYEAPISPALSGKVRGNFPDFIRKTDQERCQNLKRDIFENNKNSRYEVTVKLDGTSVTFYHRLDPHGSGYSHLGVCSRNLELKLDDNDNKDNSLIRMFHDSGLSLVLSKLGNIAIQGELMGPGIQGNRENLKQHVFYVFDVQDIDNQRYLTTTERKALMDSLINHGVNYQMVQHVPIIHEDVSLEELNINDTDALLKYAEGPSINNPVREGLVFKRHDGGFSFKAISNTFLAKEKD
jgi:RNA ligase (TIGR02306 family)